jgi:hypothetical protein
VPTRQRKVKEQEIAAQRAALEAQYNVPVPAHLIGRLGRPSKMLEALSLKGTSYNWNGLRLDDETGVVFRAPAPDYLGANVERAEAAMDRARELHDNYQSEWNTRGGAKEIAAQAGIPLSTVYAHKARLRKT